MRADEYQKGPFEGRRVHLNPWEFMKDECSVVNVHESSAVGVKQCVIGDD